MKFKIFIVNNVLLGAKKQLRPRYNIVFLLMEDLSHEIIQEIQFGLIKFQNYQRKLINTQK